MKRGLTIALLMSAAMLCGACDSMPWSKDKKDDKGHEKMAEKPAVTAVAKIRPSTAATTQPANNNITGSFTFTQTSDQTVHVTGMVSGLAPNSKHGLHIHEKGDLSAADLSSAGGHYNPTGMHHGGPPDDNSQRHAGDLGNITADASGNATVSIKLHGVSLNGQNALVGRSVIIHSGEDDLKTDPAGKSGARVAGGLIELQK